MRKMRIDQSRSLRGIEVRLIGFMIVMRCNRLLRVVNRWGREEKRERERKVSEMFTSGARKR